MQLCCYGVCLLIMGSVCHCLGGVLCDASVLPVHPIAVPRCLGRHVREGGDRPASTVVTQHTGTEEVYWLSSCVLPRAYQLPMSEWVCMQPAILEKLSH